MKYCTQCGQELSFITPKSDNRKRFVCESCGHIHYQNPLVVVGTVPYYKDKILLCKRAIEPRYGLWTLPAGFMENDESVSEGALRETFEEANAKVTLDKMYTTFSVPYINQVHIFFRAKLVDLNFSAGIESLDVQLFSQSEIPWNEIAFTPVSETLKHYFKDKEKNKFLSHYEEIFINAKTGKAKVKTV